MQDREIERLIYRSCRCLDEEDFAGYLDLCAVDFHYRITAHSPELRKEMIWLDHDRTGLAAAYRAASRFRREGRTAQILAPGIAGLDANDLLREVTR